MGWQEPAALVLVAGAAVWLAVRLMRGLRRRGGCASCPWSARK